MSGWARELVGGAKATLLAVGAKSSALAGGGWRVGVLVAKDLAHCCMLHQIESNRIASHRIGHRCSRSLREEANSNWEPLARIRAATCDGLLKRVSAESTISYTAQKAVVERTALMRRLKGGRIGP